MNNQGTEIQNVFKNAACTFAEAISLTGTHASNNTNAFGRRVAVYNEGGLSRLLGISATGLRTAAFISVEDLDKNLSTLSSFSRLHVPFTLVVDGNALGYLPKLAQAGAMVFQAQSAQELSDWILIAQVISEKALMPVVVLAAFAENDQPITLPTKKELQHWFGDNDGRVEDPTPAQTMVQGKMRRRVPGWMQTDNPILLGAKKNHRDAIVEQAARQQYDWKHIQGIIDNTLSDFAKQFSRSYLTYTSMHLEKVRNVVITTALVDPDVLDKVVQQQAFKKARIGFIGLRQLWPVALPEAINNARIDVSVVLESAVYEGEQGWLFKEVLAGNWFSASSHQNGWYANLPTEKGLHAVLLNVVNAKTAIKKYWLDLALSGLQSVYPKYQVLLQNLAREYPEVGANALTQVEGKSKPSNKPLPVAAKQYANQGAPFARLSRFYDDTACLYDQPDEQVVHPFDAVPTLPTASALYNYPAYRKEVPVFHPQKVKDVERYPAVCPHGALLTALFTIQELIKSGIAQARGRGEAISLIVPLSKVWAKHAAAIATDKKGKITLAKDLLVPAFEKTLPTAKKDPEMVKVEYEQIMLGIAEVPVALTENQYYTNEKSKADSGELFALAIDPSACTGCGSCALATAEGALEMQAIDAQVEAKMISDFNRFETLPETSAAITKRLIEDANFDSFAALLLNKSLYRTCSRGGVFWQKGAEATTVGMITALAEYTLAGNYDAISKQISVQTVGINNAIKKVLSDALPVTNLDSLMEVVTHHSEEKLNMDRVFDEWGKEQQFKAVNKDDLQRKLEVVEGLKQLKWALKEGLNGMGRTRYSVILDNSMDYLGEHPWNIFNVPVMQAGKNETAELALGVFEGELRNTIDNIRLLRRAELEATNKYKPEQHNAEIANLSWADLTPEEKTLVAPVFILGSDDLLTQKGSEPLFKAMQDGYPIKVFVLESGNVNPDAAVAQLTARANTLWPLIAQNQAFIGRGSLADSNALFTLLQEALTYTGGAVTSIFTPNAFVYDSLPARWPSLTMLAESCRLFLPMQFKPGAETAAACMNVRVTNTDDDWNKIQLTYKEKEAEKQLDYTLTFADYAYLLNNWKPLFTKLENATNAVEVAEYLDLDEAAAKTKTPVIKRVDAENNLLVYAAADEVIRATKAVRNNFHLLREWAGLYTAFPEKLREKVDADLRVAYDAEKKKLVAELAAEKKTWEGEHMETIKQQMKERLLQMAGQI